MNGGQPLGEFFLRNLIPVTLGNIVAGGWDTEGEEARRRDGMAWHGMAHP